MSGRTPVADSTSVSHVLVHVVSADALRPFDTSRSSTGTRSPEPTVAFCTNQCASLRASFAAESGFPKWYEPTVTPAARASARFLAYATSEVSVPAVARTNANALPAPATRAQSIAPWW